MNRLGVPVHNTFGSEQTIRLDVPVWTTSDKAFGGPMLRYMEHLDKELIG